MKKTIMVISLMVLFILCSCDSTTKKMDSNHNISKSSTEVNGELSSDKSAWDIEVSFKLEESDETWDKEIMDVISPEPIFDMGFIHVVNNKRLLIEVKNNDNKSLRDIEITYCITVYKHEIEFGIDKADIKGYEAILYKQFTDCIKIAEIDAGESMTEVILYMGTFPYVEVRVEKITVNGFEQLDEMPSESYLYYEFNELQDSQHLRQLFGL